MKRFSVFHRFAALALLMFTLALPGASCSGEPAGGLAVFAAAGAKPALDEICRLYEEKYSVTVEVAYGGGGEVLSQMELSRSGDVYVAPEQKFMEMAVEKGVALPETVVSIAGMIPVIGLPADNPRNIKTLEDLAAPGVRVAITRRETTLLGQYAPEIFAKAGLGGAIEANIAIEAARPDSLLTMLVMGQVDAGIIWSFYEVQSPDDIIVIRLSPEQLTGIGEMRAAVASYAADRDAAEQFVAFLTSAEGKEVFGSLGYITDEAELNRYRGE